MQELLLRSISGEDKGHYNRFMVGDVKQSIYKFRLARPEIFMEKYDTYKTGEAAKDRVRIDPVSYTHLDVYKRQPYLPQKEHPMGLKFYIGASGSGKSYHLYEDIIAQAMENPHRKYLVVVPDQFTCLLYTSDRRRNGNRTFLLY